MPGPICSQNGSASGGSSSEYPALASETEVADRATPSESIAVTLAPGTGPPSSLTIRPPWYVVSVAAAGKAKSREGEAVVSSGPARSGGRGAGGSTRTSQTPCGTRGR